MDKNEAEAVIRDTVEYANKEIEKNKKKNRKIITGIILGFFLIIAAGILFIKFNAPANNEEMNIRVLREYSQKSDGTWECDGNIYKYKLVITGRMHNAVKDSTFVYLSNSEDITFAQAWKAAGLSSNWDDYFDIDEAVLVGVG